MKKTIISLLLIGFYSFYYQLFVVVNGQKLPDNAPIAYFVDTSSATLKERALKILQTKCNSCHKRKNPFKVFSLRNMNRYAPKIYKQVFVYRKMPKGDAVNLTEEEYKTLENWINSNQ